MMVMVMVMGVCVLCLKFGQWGRAAGRSTNSKIARLTHAPAVCSLAFDQGASIAQLRYVEIQVSGYSAATK
jgi:hypothetical protein